MPGFLVSNINMDKPIKDYLTDNRIFNLAIIDNYVVMRNTINKFLDDKVFWQNDDVFFVTEGVIFNKQYLVNKYSVKNFTDVLVNMSNEIPEEFFKIFRGSFSGAYYNKVKKEWHIWTNQTGENPVFYYQQNNITIVASAPNYILECLHANNIHITVDEEAVYSMLTFSYMYDDRTYAREIKRLPPGCYIKVSEDSFIIKRYYDLQWDKYDLKNLTDSQIIEGIEKCFSKAITREFNKDCEYGYKHLVDLSAGLDSRMVNWVAREQGLEILDITYSQNNSNEDIISRQIASSLQNELLFYPLDNHKFLFDIDFLVGLNYGLSLFAAITGGQRVLSNLNMDDYGLEHTGMLGDVVIGSFLSNNKNKEDIFGRVMYSTKLRHKLKLENLFSDNNKIEKQMIYIRGLNGAASSIFIRRNYTEVSSPFMDLDVLEYCMSIPIQKRVGHKIYKKWIIEKHYLASEFRWSHDDTKITDGKILSFIRRAYYHLPKKIARMLGLKKIGTQIGMNPFDYWYITDKTLQKYWDDYFARNIKLVTVSESLKSDISNLYKDGNTIEKCQALTALGALNYWQSYGIISRTDKINGFINRKC